MSDTTHECCPPFDPQAWDEKEITWKDEPFVKDRVRSFFHIPLNFGAVMRRNVALIEAADAKPDEMIVLADENSLWGADLYIRVSKDVPGARMAALGGEFLVKVFEGPYSNIKTWIDEMTRYVASREKEVKQLYFYYTTCPRCAKKYGKNYVALLARV